MSINSIINTAAARQESNSAARKADEKNTAVFAHINGNVLEISRVRINETGVMTLSMTTLNKDTGKKSKTVRIAQATVPARGKVIAYGKWLYGTAEKQEIAGIFARADVKLVAGQNHANGYNELRKQVNQEFIALARQAGKDQGETFVVPVDSADDTWY